MNSRKYEEFPEVPKWKVITVLILCVIIITVSISIIF